MEYSPCPLCHSSKKMRKPLKLYGVPICRKCYYRFASNRQAAYVLDWIAWALITIVIVIGFDKAMISLQVSIGMIDILEFLFYWFLLPLVFFCKDGFAGHSLGKLICGVRVLHRETFEPIGFVPSLKRNLPLLVPFMPLIIAFLLQKGYRLGDGWAKTKVIWKKYAKHPVFTGLLACEHCHYDLTGNETGICSECGHAISSINQQQLGKIPPIQSVPVVQDRSDIPME
ncbi:MAG: RDD family protein [Planctomycetota bacterium]|nr:RDD family protein [Planctomycetota bacterium]